MLAEKVCDLGLYRLGEQGTRPVAQDFSELILDVSWLNQLDDVIFEHGISLLRWRSGGVKHPHDMPPFRFPPSPNLGDSSMTNELAPSGLITNDEPKVSDLNVRFGSWLCENAKTLNRDRRSYSSKTVSVAQRASGFNLEIELKNIILRRVSIFEFLHSQGHSRRYGRITATSGLPR